MRRATPRSTSSRACAVSANRLSSPSVRDSSSLLAIWRACLAAKRMSLRSSTSAEAARRRRSNSVSVPSAWWASSQPWREVLTSLIAATFSSFSGWANTGQRSSAPSACSSSIVRTHFSHSPQLWSTSSQSYWQIVSVSSASCDCTTRAAFWMRLASP